jgi:hypothetical protein
MLRRRVCLRGLRCRGARDRGCGSGARGAPTSKAPFTWEVAPGGLLPVGLTGDNAAARGPGEPRAHSGPAAQQAPAVHAAASRTAAVMVLARFFSFEEAFSCQPAWAFQGQTVSAARIFPDRGLPARGSFWIRCEGGRRDLGRQAGAGITPRASRSGRRDADGTRRAAPPQDRRTARLGCLPRRGSGRVLSMRQSCFREPANGKSPRPVQGATRHRRGLLTVLHSTSHRAAFTAASGLSGRAETTSRTSIVAWNSALKAFNDVASKQEGRRWRV